VKNEFFLVHDFIHPISDEKELGDDILRLRWSIENSYYPRNSFVTIKLIGSNKKIYRLLRGVSSEKLNANQALVSYSTYKSLCNSGNCMVSIHHSTFIERNLFFYLSNPDPRKQHAVIRDFIIIGTSFLVSILEIIRFIVIDIK